MYAAFLEEMNFAGEGGLHAELLRNRDFEALGRGNLGEPWDNIWAEVNASHNAGLPAVGPSFATLCLRSLLPPLPDLVLIEYAINLHVCRRPAGSSKHGGKLGG